MYSCDYYMSLYHIIYYYILFLTLHTISINNTNSFMHFWQFHALPTQGTFEEKTPWLPTVLQNFLAKVGLREII